MASVLFRVPDDIDNRGCNALGPFEHSFRDWCDQVGQPIKLQLTDQDQPEDETTYRLTWRSGDLHFCVVSPNEDFITMAKLTFGGL